MEKIFQWSTEGSGHGKLRSVVKILWGLIAPNHCVYWQECMLAWIIMQEVQTTAEEASIWGNSCRRNFEVYSGTQVPRSRLTQSKDVEIPHKVNLNNIPVFWEQLVQSALSPDYKHLLHMQGSDVLVFPLHSARMFSEEKRRNTNSSWNWLRKNILEAAQIHRQQASASNYQEIRF